MDRVDLTNEENMRSGEDRLALGSLNDKELHFAVEIAVGTGTWGIAAVIPKYLSLRLLLNNLRRHYAQAHRASDSRELDVVGLAKAEAAAMAGDGQNVIQHIKIENNIYGDIDNFNEYK